MKRTAFKTKLPPPRPVRQWTGSLPKPRSTVLCLVPPKLETVSFPKEQMLQHSGYMRLVRRLPCSHCFKLPPSEFSHADTGKGQGIKTDCRRGYPACKECHYLIGSTGKLGKAERRRIEDLYGRLTRTKIMLAGTWPARLPLWPA